MILLVSKNSVDVGREKFISLKMWIVKIIICLLVSNYQIKCVHLHPFDYL